MIHLSQNLAACVGWRGMRNCIRRTKLRCLVWQFRTSVIKPNLISCQTSKVKVKVKPLIRVQLFVTTWTVVYQAPPSMGFSRQEYWSGLPFPSAGDLSDPAIEPGSPAFQADALTSEPL